MMPEAWLTGLRGRMLALGVTAIAASLLWFGVAEPLQSRFADGAATLAQREALLQHMQQAAASLPDLRAAAAAQHDAADATEGFVLPGDTDALAAAGLQEQVQRMASAAGASLTTVETLPAASAGAWRRISLRITLTTPWPVLIGLLRSLHQAPIRILVDDLHVRAPSLVKATAAEPVQASVTLYGFRPAERSAMR